MRTCILYNLKRIARRKSLIAALIAIPVFLAVLMMAGKASLAFAMFISAAVTSCVFAVQHTSDSASGFLDGIFASPAPRSTAIFSRVISGAITFALQAIILIIPLALRS